MRDAMSRSCLWKPSIEGKSKGVAERTAMLTEEEEEDEEALLSLSSLTLFRID